MIAAAERRVKQAVLKSNENPPEPYGRRRRPWKPDARDHFIYHLVRFDGFTQQEAADRQRISQATVSRIIDRYERWQAHADPREGGRLDAAERLRAQRWLTYERNELILGSALRIAREVEGKTDLTKYVRTEPSSPYAADKGQIRDESTTIDRTGIVARFLRLAFRVNMEQLALVEKEEAPRPAELSAEEIAEEAARDAAVKEDLEARDRRDAESMEEYRRERAAQEAAEALAAEAAPLAGTKPGSGEPSADAAPLHDVHNLHKISGHEIAATADAPCTCAADAGLEKTAEVAGMTALPGANESEWAAASG